VGQITCDAPTQQQANGFEFAMNNPPATATVKGQPQLSDDGDTARVTLHIAPEEENPFVQPQDFPYEFSKSDGSWCLTFGWHEFERFGA
jgi:hypothetical protein